MMKKIEWIAYDSAKANDIRHRYERAEAHTIEELYKRPSSKKVREYTLLMRKVNEMNGYGVRLWGSCHFFSLVFKRMLDNREYIICCRPTTTLQFLVEPNVPVD